MMDDFFTGKTEGKLAALQPANLHLSHNVQRTRGPWIRSSVESSTGQAASLARALGGVARRRIVGQHRLRQNGFRMLGTKRLLKYFH